jgi:hypothetical protein
MFQCSVLGEATFIRKLLMSRRRWSFEIEEVRLFRKIKNLIPHPLKGT